MLNCVLFYFKIGEKMFKGLLTAVVIFMVANAAMAQSKIGVVDFQSVIMQLPEAQNAESMLKKTTGDIQDSLVKMQKELQEKVVTYQKQKGMMNQEQQQKTEEGLQGQNELIQKFRQEKEQEIYKLRIDLLEPLRAKVVKAVADVAKTEKMSFVLDKTNPALIFSEDKSDITFKVLDTIKRGGSEK